MVVLLALLAVGSGWREWNVKGLAAQRSGLYREAARSFEAGISETGGDHAARAQLQNNLGAALYSAGDLGPAERAYTGALKDWDNAGPALSEDRAICRLNLAVLLRGTARLAAARLHAQTGTAELLRLGVRGPKLASAQQTLAEIARLEGNYDEAESHLGSATAALGADLEPVLRGHILQTQGSVWHDRGDSARAEPLMRAALAEFRRAKGTEHPFSASALVALGHELLALGRLDEAQDALEQGYAASKRVFGPSHARTGTAANNLAQLYLARGRLADAEPLYRQALEILESIGAREHADTAKVIANLGDLFAAQGKVRGAEALYQRALAISEKAAGKNHRQTVAILEKWANLLEKQKRGAELKRVRARWQ